jgi:hypothetical protein
VRERLRGKGKAECMVRAATRPAPRQSEQDETGTVKGQCPKCTKMNWQKIEHHGSGRYRREMAAVSSRQGYLISVPMAGRNGLGRAVVNFL